MRKKSLFLPLVVLLSSACGAVRYPVPAELATVAPLRVSGRQGVLVNQRLAFGPYATGEVSRSSARGTDVTDRLDSHGADYRQRYSFALSRDGSKVSDVECTAEGSGRETLSVQWRLKRVLSCRLTSPDGTPHILRLESSLDAPLAGRVTGREAFDVAGSNRVGSGRVAGTAGYTITRSGGGPVAAVDVIDDGAVYIAGPGDDLLAAVAAALLLYQDPLQAAERFRDP